VNACAATRARKKYCIPIEFFLYPILAAPINANIVAAAPTRSQHVRPDCQDCTDGDEWLLATFIHEEIPSTQDLFVFAIDEGRVVRVGDGVRHAEAEAMSKIRLPERSDTNFWSSDYVIVLEVKTINGPQAF
jgi:hypothetical protein